MDFNKPEEYISKHNSYFDRISQEEIEASDPNNMLKNNELVVSEEDKYLQDSSLDKRKLWDSILSRGITYLETPTQERAYNMLDTLQLHYFHTLNLSTETPEMSSRAALLKWLCAKQSESVDSFSDGSELTCDEQKLMSRYNLDLAGFRKSLGGLDFFY